MRPIVIVFAIFFIYLSQPAFCQTVAIQNERENVLYVGVPNFLIVAVENTSSIAVSLTTDNGEIRNDGHGRFSVTPMHEGGCKIYVYKRVLKKAVLIDSMFYRARFVLLSAKFAGKTGGEISAIQVYVQIASSAYPISNGYFCIDLLTPIVRFTIVIQRNGRDVFTRLLEDPKGVRIDKTTKLFFGTLQNNDRLIFKNIILRYPSRVDDLEFTITNAEDLADYLKNHVNDVEIDPVTNEEINTKKVVPVEAKD